MRVVYCDTSILVDLIEGNTFASSTRKQLSDLRQSGAALASSALTLVEIGRYLKRRDPHKGVVANRASSVTAALDLLDITNQVVTTAASLPTPRLRSLDAIHVASALLVKADVVLTRDRQLAQACQDLGLQVA